MLEFTQLFSLLAVGIIRHQAGFQRRCYQQLQVAAADFRIGKLGGDDLALLGQTDLAVDGAWRLRQDRLVARAAATADGAAAAMEQA